MSHFSFLWFCFDTTALPETLLRRSRSPDGCSDRHHSHPVFLSRDQMLPQGRTLMNLGQEACSALNERLTPRNAYRSLGHRAILVLEGQQPRLAIAKLHQHLDKEEDNAPEWARRVAECLSGFGKVGPSNCSRAQVVHEVNPALPRCHSNLLTRLLERRPQAAVNRQPSLALILHPALALLEGSTGDSWPFPRYLGGCGIFAVTEYMGCPLSDFTNFPITVKVRSVPMRARRQFFCYPDVDLAIHFDGY